MPNYGINESAYMNARTGKKLRATKMEKNVYPQRRGRMRGALERQSETLTKGIGYARNSALKRSTMGST
jgi:hypothetical protein